MSTYLDKKFKFLKSVKMPDRQTIVDCAHEYAGKKNQASLFYGMYGYFVGYKTQDMIKDEECLYEPDRKHLNDIEWARFFKEIDSLNAVDENYSVHSKDDDFRHVYLGEHRNTECRLYLRILPTNIVKLATILSRKCFEKRLPTHFKFALSRNDSLVLYTNYDYCQDFVDIIEEIRKQNPELFKGAENTHPLWGVIDGFIGFMEEPQQPYYVDKLLLPKSASTYRTKFLEDMTHHATFKYVPHDGAAVPTSYLRTFTEPLDIDPNYLALNASSVQELKNAGYDVSLIGTEPYVKPFTLK